VSTTNLDVADVFTAFLDWDEVARLVRHARADDSVLRRAMRHPEARLRSQAAAQLSDDPTVMELAAGDTNNEVRQVAAMSSHTPHGALASLVNDRSRVVRQLLARNYATPPHTVEQLAFDPATEVRLGVAWRPLSIAAIEHLAGDESVLVRETVARRSDLPMHVRVMLAGDEYARVRALMARLPAPPEVYERLAADRASGVVRALAANPRISHHLCMQLARHADRLVRMELARHTDDPEALDLLAEDRELSVRALVALSEDLPAATAARMMRSPSGLVKRSVLVRHHDVLPDDVVQTALEQLLGSPKADLRADLRTRFADRITPRVITEPPALDDRRGLFEVVDQGLPFDLIAHAVAHPSLPVTVRAALLEHPHAIRPRKGKPTP